MTPEREAEIRANLHAAELLAALDAERARAERLAKGLGSCVWVLDNRHNSATAVWEPLAAAALEDARAALAEAEA